MVYDPVFRCPGCRSLLTAEAVLPGIWECQYCACFIPVELGEDIMESFSS